MEGEPSRLVEQGLEWAQSSADGANGAIERRMAVAPSDFVEESPDFGVGDFLFP